MLPTQMQVGRENLYWKGEELSPEHEQLSKHSITVWLPRTSLTETPQEILYNAAVSGSAEVSRSPWVSPCAEDPHSAEARVVAASTAFRPLALMSI